MKVLINGIGYEGLADWNIAEKVGNPTSSTLRVLVESQPVPQSGDVVEFLDDNDTVIFFGILGIPKSPAYSSPYEPRIYNLNCTNGNAITQRRLANVSYSNKTMTEIVNDLFDRYIAGEGITKGTISEIDTPTFEVYNCKNMNLMSVLNELAGFIGGVWQITNDKVFNFVKLDDFPHCSQVLTLDNAPFGNLQRTDNAKDLRTNQIIDGAFLTTDPQTEQYMVTDDWSGFDTVFPIIQQPSMSINGTPVPDDAIGVRGIDDEDEDVLFLWSYNSRQVSVNRNYTGSITLAVNDVVQIVYVGMAPIRYEVMNSDKADEIAQKTGLSGIIDNLYVDSTIVTRQDAVNKAEALLQQYGEQKNTIRCVTDSHTLLMAGFVPSDIELYTQWTFDIPELDMVGEYVITEKTLKPLRLDDDSSMAISLTFMDRDFVQSYGETISKLYFDVTKLSVRAEETVILDMYLSETTELVEELEDGAGLPLFVAQAMYNGQIALPLGTIMPNLCHGGGDEWRRRWTVFATDVDTGEICSPYLGEDQYVCGL